ncbi:opsin 1 [Penaeus vannamei]|uniref:Opsin 1 n=1 Tax=Penaeus vannamei TaxID=6689 RepID=A0A423U0Z9_PENVA|nr:opsin 1 [Penaeus vannamei]
MRQPTHMHRLYLHFSQRQQSFSQPTRWGQHLPPCDDKIHRSEGRKRSGHDPVPFQDGEKEYFSLSGVPLGPCEKPNADEEFKEVATGVAVRSCTVPTSKNWEGGYRVLISECQGGSWTKRLGEVQYGTRLGGVLRPPAAPDRAVMLWSRSYAVVYGCVGGVPWASGHRAISTQCIRAKWTLKVMGLYGLQRRLQYISRLPWKTPPRAPLARPVTVAGPPRTLHSYSVAVSRADKMVFANASGPHAEAYTGQVVFGYPEGVTVVDLVPENIRHMIHPHWNNYPPVNPMWHYVLGCIYIILGCLSFFGNGLVILLYLKNKFLRTPSNQLVLNLAISDFLMLMTQFPFFTYNCFSGGVWMFSETFCELYAFFGAITGIASIWTLSFISYDRYNVIVKGVSGTPLTSGRATAFVLFAWIYAIAWSLPPFFGWGKYIPEGE